MRWMVTKAINFLYAKVGEIGSQTEGQTGPVCILFSEFCSGGSGTWERWLRGRV